MSEESFQLIEEVFIPKEQAKLLCDPAAGGYCAFEGWVRDHNEGRPVKSLEYEAYPELAIKEGSRIIKEAHKKFEVPGASCIHRLPTPSNWRNRRLGRCGCQAPRRGFLQPVAISLMRLNHASQSGRRNTTKMATGMGSL